LIVDTGSGFHAISKRFADSLGFRTELTDGKARSPDNVLSPLGVISGVTITSSSAPLYSGRIAVVQLPEELDRLGVAGLFSPQYLPPRGTTVLLDFVRGRLGVLQGSLTIADRNGPGYALARDGMKVCRPKTQEIGGFYLVKGKIDGADGWLEIDTGASSSWINANSPVGQKLQHASSLIGANHVGVGGVAAGSLARGVPVEIGEFKGKLDLILVAGRKGESCAMVGGIGMDLLSSCIVALDMNDGVARCLTDQGKGS
jgi:hypothetical protein